MTTRPSATATRSVASLPETSTMRASPRLAEMGELCGRLGAALGFLATAISPPARGARSRASSARVAAATSACRIRLSPTRNVAMPTRGEPGEIGRRVDAAFADDHMRSAGTRGASRSLTASEVLNSCEIAVVDADQPRPQLQARGRVRLRRAPRPAHPCRMASAASSMSLAAPSSTAAMMIRMQSAPSARDSATCRART